MLILITLKTSKKMENNQPEPNNDDNQQDLTLNAADQQPIINQSVLPEKQIDKKRQKLSKKTIYLILTISIICIALLTGALLLLSNSKVKESPTPTPTSSNRTKIDGVSFLDKPKKLSNLNLISNLNYFGESCSPPDYTTNCKPTLKSEDVLYYEIGSSSDSSKILAMIIPQGIDSSNYILLQKDKNYIMINKLSDNAYLSGAEGTDTNSDAALNLQAAFSPSVSFDSEITIPNLEFPKEITVSNQKLKLITSGYLMENGISSIRGSFYGPLKNSNPIKINEVNGKIFYKVVVTDNPTYTVNEIRATVKGVYAAGYTLIDDVAGSKDSLQINWTSGDRNVSKYYSAGGGCGSASGYVVTKNIQKADLINVGTSKDGQKIYQIKNSAPLAIELYEKDYQKGADLEDASLKNLSAQQFTDKHGYIIVENGLGEFVVFLRDDMFVRGGCAKPVVYLYPEKTTNVSVKVGANVTISDPQYPKNGWKDVTAKPNGDLIYQSKPYGSLFWEGQGNGVYPEITSGTIVKKEDALRTIEQQLGQQGIRGREVQEFIDFWKPNLPNTPFIRLSWLSTQQLNELAPLTISPRPNTVIRVFLDFEGLQRPITIRQQTFTTPQRKGFTVVEWGGLARNGLQKLVR
jgi:hypothetical protein